VEAMETRIRNCIHSTLFEVHGEAYWRMSIPEAIRKEAEKRVEAEIKSNPDRDPKELASARLKLDFCNVMDYVPIIIGKGNWPHFQTVFRKKEDVQQQIKAFSDYRNATVHVRDMSEFLRLGGERAMIWLESVLSEEPEPEGGDEETPDESE